MKRAVEELSPREILSLAIHVERSNARRMRAFADVFRGYDDEVAAGFDELAAQETEHERMLADRFRQRWEDDIPVLDESEVEGIVESIDLDDAEHQIFNSLKTRRVYELALKAELEAREFYRRAAAVAHPDIAPLFRELADTEGDHVAWLEGKVKP